jgi:hypothetical protein
LAIHYVDGFIGYLMAEHQLDVTYINGGNKTMEHKENIWNEIVMTGFKILVINFWRMGEKP